MLSAIGCMLSRTCHQCVSGNNKVFNGYLKKKKVSLNTSGHSLVRSSLEPCWCPSVIPNQSAKELVN